MSELSERQKAIERVKKLLRQAESEGSVEVGNYGAAELFRNKADEQILKFSIRKEELVEVSDVKFVNELGKSILTNPFTRLNAKLGTRIFWFENLAKLVAEGYNCECEVDRETGILTFYGYDLDREIALFMLLKLAEISDSICKSEMSLKKSEVGKLPVKSMFGGITKTFPTEWMGDEVFTDSFQLGFYNATKEIYAKHELDANKKHEVEEYFESNKKHYSRYSYYSDEPKISSILNEEIIQLGYKTGFNVNKKAQNAPSALTVTKTNGNASEKIVDADTIYLCLDDSGSMAFHRKIESAKKGAITFAENAFKNGKAVGLIKFGEGASHILRPQTEMSERFVKAINKLSARGASTDMHLAIQTAQGRLLNRKRKRTICIVTDGQPSNRIITLQIAADAKRDGIEIAAIGTDDADQEFLNKLCSRDGLGILVERNQLALGIGEMANKL